MSSHPNKTYLLVRNTYVKAIYSVLALCALSLLIAGCGMMGGANVNVNMNANTNTAANTAVPTNVGPANAGNANSNSNANANTAKTDSGPKRISFSKGSDWTSESLTLAGGQSKQFVINAGDMQYLTVEPSSKDVKILMISKKNVNIDQEGSTLAVHTNSKGDYIFEVRNPGTKEVKTSIKVQVVDEGGE